MREKNYLLLSEATVREALQEWLDRRMTRAPLIVAVEPDDARVECLLQLELDGDAVRPVVAIGGSCGATTAEQARFNLRGLPADRVAPSGADMTPPAPRPHPTPAVDPEDGA